MKPIDYLAELSQNIATVVSEGRTFERQAAEAQQARGLAEYERNELLRLVRDLHGRLGAGEIALPGPVAAQLAKTVSDFGHVKLPRTVEMAAEVTGTSGIDAG